MDGKDGVAVEKEWVLAGKEVEVIDKEL